MKESLCGMHPNQRYPGILKVLQHCSAGPFAKSGRVLSSDLSDRERETRQVLQLQSGNKSFKDEI